MVMMTQLKFSFLLFAISFVLTGCNDKNIAVIITNEADFNRQDEIVELDANLITEITGGEYWYVSDCDGTEIPSQLTHDNKLIFRVTVPSHSEVGYNIITTDSLHSYPNLVYGREYPERSDDIAWENENGGFRIYGPATQQKGEKAFGYDLFFKHPTDELIVEKLYAPETSTVTWHKVDSLRAIDNALAEQYIQSFSYHIDHGLGMDCYAVGPTLGAGVAALLDNDSICFQWCYTKAEILDNGPLRFAVKLKFSPMNIGEISNVIEHRIITLDSKSRLNKTMVWYDNLDENRYIVAGFPIRDKSFPITDAENGIMAYADPTQGTNNGKALLGIVFKDGIMSMSESFGHILGKGVLAPSDTFEYYWGFAWDKTDIQSMKEWEEYLYSIAQKNNSPLKIKLQY